MSEDPELDKLVGRFAATRALAARAMAENPWDARSHFGAGVGLRLTGDYAGALAALERANELEPNNALVLIELATVQEIMGQFVEAAQTLRQALQRAPDSFQAMQALVQLERQTPEANHISRLEQMFAGKDEEGWRTLYVGHALAKTYEDLGQWEKSFDWLARAKAHRRSLRPYAPPAERELVDAVFSSAAALRQAPRQGWPSREPIFVCGLPRSGTTLVDRILSSHPEVTSAGEIANFAAIWKRLAGTRTAMTLDVETFSAAPAMDLAALGRLYVDSTRPLTGVAARFVDKAPSHYLMAAFILAALPDARVVCLRRHPLDTCLSNYRQIFPTQDRYYDYAYDLEAIAHKYVQFDRVLSHWREVLPADRYRIVQYEELIANQEAETRTLLAFCGLDWNEACMSFHENKAGIATPSATQVRQPIYASAKGRYAKYGELLDPARRILEAAGLRL